MMSKEVTKLMQKVIMFSSFLNNGTQRRKEVNLGYNVLFISYLAMVSRDIKRLMYNVIMVLLIS